MCDLDAARDLQLVQARHSDRPRSGTTTPRSTTSSRSRRRQSPHPQERQYNRSNSRPRHQQVYDESSLQNSIYRKFEETETLLDQLRIQEGLAGSHPQVTNRLPYHSSKFVLLALSN